MITCLRRWRGRLFLLGIRWRCAWVGELGIVFTSRLVQRLGLFGQIRMGTHIILLETRHNGSRSRGTRPTGEEHHASTSARNGQMKQGGGDRERTSSTACGTLIIGNRPGILSQIFQNTLNDKTTFTDWKEESLQDLFGWSSRHGLLLLLWLTWLSWLLLLLRSTRHGTAQQFSDTSRRVLAIASEDIRLGNAFRGQFINADIGSKGN